VKIAISSVLLAFEDLPLQDHILKNAWIPDLPCACGPVTTGRAEELLYQI